MACVLLAEAIQCTCDRKAATGSFNKGLKIKSTTVLLSGGWVPMIPRSFHYGHPASYLAGKSWQPSYEPHVAGKKADTVTMRTSVEKGEERNHL